MASMPPLKTRLIPNLPLRDQAYNALKDAILSGRFSPGDHLVELEIASSLGLSRSPVREAFRRLEQEGFLHVARSGVIVQQTSFKDIQGVYFVRRHLEGLGAALAAKHATKDEIALLRHALKVMEIALKEKNVKKIVLAGNRFHAILYSLSDNPYLIDLLTKTYEKIRHFRTVNVSVQRRGRDAVNEHRAIVNAIARHDASKAKRLSQTHILKSWAHTRRSLPQSSDDEP